MINSYVFLLILSDVEHCSACVPEFKQIFEEHLVCQETLLNCLRGNIN